MSQLIILLQGKLLSLMIQAFKKISGTFTGLLFTLIAALILQAAFEGQEGLSLLLNVSTLVVVFFSMIGVCTSRKTLLIGLALAVPAVLPRWSEYFFVLNKPTLLFSNFFYILFLGFISILIIKHIFNAERITADLIAGGISVYFVLGLCFSFIYLSLEILEPYSFRFSGERTLDSLPITQQRVFGYYSLVVLTTLGFGDIVPVSSLARSITVVEALLGQVYIAVLVAGLVGVAVSQLRK